MAYTKTYRTYRYINKNPVIDVARTAIQDTNLYNKQGIKIVATLATLSKATLDGWFYGDTRSPRHDSIAAVMTALGYVNEWKKDRKLNVEEELPLAKAWLKREKDKREKENPPKKRKAKKAA